MKVLPGHTSQLLPVSLRRGNSLWTWPALMIVAMMTMSSCLRDPVSIESTTGTDEEATGHSETPTATPTCVSTSCAKAVQLSTGQCQMEAFLDGTSCQDKNACLTGRTCQDGICQGGGKVMCSAINTCGNVGACDPKSGCSYPTEGQCQLNRYGLKISKNPCNSLSLTTPITFGGQDAFKMAVTTWDSALTIGGSACQSCQGKASLYAIGPTTTVLPNAVSVDGSGAYSWVGRQVTDRVTTPVSAQSRSLYADLTFGVATKQTDLLAPSYCSAQQGGKSDTSIDGRLGLSSSSELEINIVDQLVAQKKIERVFAFTPSTASLPPMLWLGGIDLGQRSPKLSYTPMTISATDKASGYRVQMSSIAVNGRTVDTGSTPVQFAIELGITIMPDRLFQKLLDVFYADPASANLPRSFFVKDAPCLALKDSSSLAQLDKTLPKFTLTFPAAVGPTPVNLALNASQSILKVVPTGVDTAAICQGIQSGAWQDPPNNEIIYWGSNTMSNHSFSFNIQAEQLGIGPAPEE